MKPGMMRPLWLDYQHAGPGHGWPGRVLLGIGVLVCALLFARFAAVTAEHDEAEQGLARLKRAADRPQAVAGEARRGAPVSRAAPAATRWEALLAALEGAVDESVTLLALTPHGREVTINGEARDLGAVFDYVKRLQGVALFSHVYLLRHEALAEHPYRPVQFALSARWFDGAGERR